MNTADLLKTVRMMLGDGSVSVELLDDHIRTAAGFALSKVNAYIPPRYVGDVPVASSGFFYVLSAATTPAPTDPFVICEGFQGVSDVSVARAREYTTLSGYEDPFNIRVTAMGGIGSTVNMSTFWQIADQTDTMNKLIGNDVEFHAQPAVVTLGVPTQVTKVWVNLPRFVAQRIVMMRWIGSYSVSDSLLSGIPAVPIGLQEWVTEYTLAETKGILARIRGKFGGIPTPDGSDLQLDHLEMQTDSDTTKNELMQRLLNMRKTLAVGIF